jgi:dihydrofolate reductase
VIKGDVAGEVVRLKRQPGKYILVVGSSGLAQTLIQHDLVDKYHLWLHPVVLGSGKRLIREGPTTNLKLVDFRMAASGLVILTYEPDRNQGGDRS